ncbi:hypothetical protein, partial [Saccharothrix sp. Mg75]|uniref:hypothetical protein n=1 Tax=Saccharothrix sp. Mg75 TaxID=3445357 RepID=UPI003EE8D13B
KVVLLGEYRAERLVAPLRAAGAEVVVLGGPDLGPWFGDDVPVGHLPVEPTDEAVADLLRHWAPDLAVPNVRSPGQEQHLPVYARLGGPRLPVHPPAFADLATDKVAFHRTAVERGWPVPHGAVCGTPAELLAAPVALPAVVKEARSESYAGRYFVTDRDHLRRLSAELVYPVLVQRAVTGEEFAVELLTTPGGTTTWPVASLGTLDSACAPGGRVRVEPATLPPAAADALAGLVADVVKAYRPHGPWQLDLAVADDGGLVVFELNARFGGLSNMSWLSTGTDPHATHVDAVLGRPLPEPEVRRVAVELPVRNDVDLPPPPPGVELHAFVAGPTNPTPTFAGFYRAVVAVDPARAAEARAWVAGLPLDLTTPAAVLAQLDRGLRALRRRTARRAESG